MEGKERRVEEKGMGIGIGIGDLIHFTLMLFKWWEGKGLRVLERCRTPHFQFSKLNEIGKKGFHLY